VHLLLQKSVCSKCCPTVQLLLIKKMTVQKEAAAVGGREACQRLTDEAVEPGRNLSPRWTMFFLWIQKSANHLLEEHDRWIVDSVGSAWTVEFDGAMLPA
jgi:hypothetical protein